ncbi:hypothetical protein PIB30_006403 [Stylosanthes scabra]|uniref:Uncharacterized protein n=1 Tax=Stylosanthes scabra TaxID=79078 RepID=A0ABU6T413_9FABA|nr:hypothetical protein [Stylosanthes scabra]
MQRIQGKTRYLNSAVTRISHFLSLHTHTKTAPPRKPNPSSIFQASSHGSACHRQTLPIPASACHHLPSSSAPSSRPPLKQRCRRSRTEASSWIRSVARLRRSSLRLAAPLLVCKHRLDSSLKLCSVVRAQAPTSVLRLVIAPSLPCQVSTSSSNRKWNLR